MLNYREKTPLIQNLPYCFSIHLQNYIHNRLLSKQEDEDKVHSFTNSKSKIDIFHVILFHSAILFLHEPSCYLNTLFIKRF